MSRTKHADGIGGAESAAQGNPIVKVRHAVPTDVADLATLIGMLASHHGDRSTTDPDALRTDLFGPTPWGIVIVAERGPSIVGYAFLVRLYLAQFAKRVMDLHHLFVVPEARHMGVGRALMRATVEEAKSQGCKQVSVGTHPDNASAQAFYRKLGFAEIPPPRGPKFKFHIE